MGKATRAVAVAALALVTPACGGDTGIILEISMSAELEATLDQNGEDFDKLRVWVGHTTEDPSFFRASDDAFFTTSRDRADFATPYRYFLEPTGELTAIGSMVFAAAVGDDPDDSRLPFRISGFDVADAPMGFGDGEVRVVPLVLGPPSGVSGGVDDACIVWGIDTQAPSRIAPDDDLDCDGAVGADDCDDLDPRKNNLDRDSDGTSSCAGDCMDDPRFDLPWIDPAHVHPGAIDAGENDSLACDHIDDDCDGICQNPQRDGDGSGATVCGAVDSGGVVCDLLPADCDESRAGNQPLTFNVPEACNARDDSCDGFLPPPLACLFSDGACHWGQVTCNELEGAYAGEGGQLECKPLPDGFSDPDAGFGFCDGTPAAACLDTGDPVGCAYGEAVGARAFCQVTARSAGCAPDRTTLAFPGTAPQDGCQWLVVGGTMQAEWEIGFVSANSTIGAPILPTIAECTPQLAVRSHVGSPAARSVLLLLRGGDAAFGVKPMVVHLDTEIVGECTGQLQCGFAGAN